MSRFEPHSDVDLMLFPLDITGAARLSDVIAPLQAHFKTVLCVYPCIKLAANWGKQG